MIYGFDIIMILLMIPVFHSLIFLFASIQILLASKYCSLRLSSPLDVDLCRAKEVQFLLLRASVLGACLEKFQQSRLFGSVSEDIEICLKCLWDVSLTTF